MVVVVCSNCNSENIKLDESEKYLVCGNCNDKQYIRDLDIGFKKLDESRLKISIW